MNRRTLLFALVVGLLATTTAHAQTRQGRLYGLSSSTPGTIYEIDTTTGAATFLFDLGGSSDFVSFTGLELLNGLFYATDVFDGNEFTFGSIDPNTGVYTVINSQDGATDWHGLAADPNSNLLYSVELNSGGFSLVSVTTTGTVTNIGDTNENMRGLAFDSNSNTLYGVDIDLNLYSIDVTDGSTTLIGASGLGGNFRPGLAYDPNSDVLYLNLGDGTGGNSLYSLDTTTGVATLIGSNGATNGNGIDGLAFGTIVAVPEPTTLALVGIGLAGTAASSWYRRQKAKAKIS